MQFNVECRRRTTAVKFHVPHVTQNALKSNSVCKIDELNGEPPTRMTMDNNSLGFQPFLFYSLWLHAYIVNIKTQTDTGTLHTDINRLGCRLYYVERHNV